MLYVIFQSPAIRSLVAVSCPGVQEKRVMKTIAAMVNEISGLCIRRCSENKYREILEVITLLVDTLTDITLRFIEEVRNPDWEYNQDRYDEKNKINYHFSFLSPFNSYFLAFK